MWCGSGLVKPVRTPYKENENESTLENIESCRLGAVSEFGDCDRNGR